MRVVPVTGIVEIQDFRLRVFEDEFHVLHHRRVFRQLDLITRVAELHHDAVLTHIGRFALLHEAHFLHLLVGVAGIRPFARAARTIRDHHAAEPLILVMKALGDAVIRGDFEVVLVGDNAQMRHAAQGGPGVGFVGNVEIVFGMSELHSAAIMHGGRGSAKAIPSHVAYRLDKAPRHAIIAAQFHPFTAFSMSFIAQISEDLKNAMRAKDTVALNVIRNLKSALKYAAIEKLGADGELGDTDALAVVRKEIKKLQDSVEGAEKAGRAEAVDAAKAEIAVLEKYLPAAMSAEELGTLVEAVIAELGATSKKEMGSVMKALSIWFMT